MLEIGWVKNFILPSLKTTTLQLSIFVQNGTPAVMISRSPI